MKRAVSQPPLLLVVVLSLAAFLLVTTGFATTAASQKEAPRKHALINQILTERQNVDDLDEAVTQLRAQVETAQNQAGKQSSAMQQTQQEQNRLAQLAATTALQGPATIVRVSDAPVDGGSSAPRPATAFGTDRVQDHDIQLIVNALFASGAEAIAINDNRISAVTPIRAAGGTIVVNYRPVNSPYRITAIGANKKSFEQTPIAQNFSQWKKQFKLGYSVTTSKKTTVPAYIGRVAIDVAQPSRTMVNP